MTYWILPLSALAGVGLGLRYRAVAVAAASLMVPVVVVVLAVLRGWSPWATAALGGAALISLQAGYLVGIALDGERPK